jgi:hypothetical protein
MRSEKCKEELKMSHNQFNSIDIVHCRRRQTMISARLEVIGEAATNA